MIFLSLKKEEENHNEHGTQQEDRVVLPVDIKGLVGFWNHGNDCCSLQARRLGCSLAV